jgi:L-malate glycosyltransferase
MRVFHLIKGLGRGGAEMLLTDGPRISDPARFTYAFGYFVPYKNALVAELEEHFPKVECFPAATPLAMSGRILDVARHLRRWRADVLHCHLPLAGVVGRLAARLARIPVIYTEHNLIERYHPGTRIAAKATWRMQRHVIAVSGEVANSVKRHLGDAVPVTVVSNGVSLERFASSAALRTEARARLGIDAATPVVGTVAVFRKQKRLDLWLEVARRQLTARPDAKFLLVGDGPLRGELVDRSRALGIERAIIMPGLQPDVRPYLAAMDAYLMTSDFEGLPIALLEAMASGLTPVVTAAGGIAELIENGKSGFVLARGDVPAITEALGRVILTDSAERAAWGAAAQRRVAAEYSTGRMMRQIEQVYEDVVTRH